MSVKKRGLGRSLDALLGSSQPQAVEAAGDELRDVALDSLVAGRHQPRRTFDQQQLEALAESIRAQGVVQPIIVREVEGGQHEIVAGERRWRAAKLAGLTVIPAVVRKMEDRAAMAVALVENIQRADLNPLEESQALHRLLDDCQLTHEQVAEAVGKSRAGVSNLLRLMELNEDVQALVRESRLSLGHAKVLLGAEGARQSSLAKLVADQGMSVRQTEALVHAKGDKPSKAEKAANPAAAEVESRLRSSIGLPVSVQQDAKGRGRITIKFKSGTELEGLLQRIA